MTSFSSITHFRRELLFDMSHFFNISSIDEVRTWDWKLLFQVRFQHERYPRSVEQASRQVLLIYDAEVRDRLKASKINKFLYQYSSNEMPRQTYANMVNTIHHTQNNHGSAVAQW